MGSRRRGRFDSRRRGCIYKRARRSRGSNESWLTTTTSTAIVLLVRLVILSPAWRKLPKKWTNMESRKRSRARHLDLRHQKVRGKVINRILIRSSTSSRPHLSHSRRPRRRRGRITETEVAATEDSRRRAGPGPRIRTHVHATSALS